ncbi:hypothetical protein FGG08_006034 [Glutinoglossum americanum]|uniref:Aminoglycoside phosphotransferase domain-containing protein n=1 Tax=Glutinoglossum americanum TaxID=1670608 RepID=A0A9P8HZ68_9PEZI|nr:hypothetical protein FGG08_006034 [Glutinoglossum americanum]
MVVVVSDTFLVKYGNSVKEIEGWNLLFVEQYLKIPAPRLYAMFQESGEIFLVMEYIRGNLLRDVWPTLEERDKMTIVGKLKGILYSMRSLPSPGYFGNVLRGPFSDEFFWSMSSDPSISGPFRSGNELCSALVAKLKSNSEDPSKVEFFKTHLPQLLGRHPPTFTHTDLQQENIIVQEIDHGQLRDYKVFIIDWEDAGWFPSYWEYASLFIGFHWRDDWLAKAEHFVDPWPAEAAMMKFVYMQLALYCNC